MSSPPSGDTGSGITADPNDTACSPCLIVAGLAAADPNATACSPCLIVAGLAAPGSNDTACSPSSQISTYALVRGLKWLASAVAASVSSAGSRPVSGAGQAQTLRTTSPHAASVVSNSVCTLCMSRRRLVFGTV